MSLRRRLLLPLVPLYAAGLHLDHWIQRQRRSSRRSLEGAVISVGSISAGGAGKTPVVLALTQILTDREYAVCILTRGYKRSSKQTEPVDPNGDAIRFGDEPMLLAQRSGVPVYVGADRYEAGLLAQARPANATIVHILDDGFQHRQLARDLDIVLLTREDVTDVLLPAGNLREPLTALRSADIIILREDEAASLKDFVAVLTRESGSPPVWHIRRSLQFARPTLVLPKRSFAFCGIARPQSFINMLTQQGLTLVATTTFSDHHRYSQRDIDRLLKHARNANADGFITTEKDAVKLSPGMRERLEWLGPLHVPELKVTFVDEHTVLEQLISKVAKLNRRQDRRYISHPDGRSARAQAR